MKITLARSDYLGIGREGTRGYPHECCGILLGTWREDGTRVVSEIRPVENANTDSPHNRYLIRPEVLLLVTKEAERRGLEVVGFYHSHPNVPSVPSTFDREHAWPGYGYVIVSVKEGTPGEMRAWFLQDDRSEFKEAELSVFEDAAHTQSHTGGG